MNRAAAAHLAGFKPSLAVPSEGHSLSGDTGRCIDSVVAQVVLTQLEAIECMGRKPGWKFMSWLEPPW